MEGVRPKGLAPQEVCYRQSRGEVGSWRAPGGESGGMAEEKEVKRGQSPGREKWLKGWTSGICHRGFNNMAAEN